MTKPIIPTATATTPASTPSVSTEGLMLAILEALQTESGENRFWLTDHTTLFINDSAKRLIAKMPQRGREGLIYNYGPGNAYLADTLDNAINGRGIPLSMNGTFEFKHNSDIYVSVDADNTTLAWAIEWVE